VLRHLDEPLVQQVLTRADTIAGSARAEGSPVTDPSR